MAEIHGTRIEALQLEEEPRSHLLDLARTLARTLHEDLVSLSVYGAVARGEWWPGGDLELLLVLRGAGIANLDRIDGPLAAARRRARISPLVLSEDEVDAASDVLALRFAEIRRYHVCIAGDDPLPGFEADPERLRFLCEYELRQIALDLRRAFLVAQGRRRLGNAALHRFDAQLEVPLRTLCELAGHEVPAETAATLALADEVLGCPVEVLHELRALRRARRRPGDGELARLYDAFQGVVTAAVNVAQRLEGGRDPEGT